MVGLRGALSGRWRRTPGRSSRRCGARDIPYVVKGLNRLFDSPEIQAVVGIFRYMVRIGVRVRPARPLGWTRSSSRPDGDWAAALKVLDEGRDFDRGERWGVYNIQRLYLDFLEALGMREDTLPGDPVRRELVFYQLGKFSQAISDFEQIYFTTEPKEKYEAFAKWLEYQAPGYYADSDADVGYAAPDAVTIATVHQAKGMQWPAVFLPVPAQEPVPVEASGRARAVPRHPGRGDRRCGPLPRHASRTRRACSTSPSPARRSTCSSSFSPGDNQLYRKRSRVLRPLRVPAVVLDRDTGVPGRRPAA